MLVIPEEIKELFRENNNRKETQKSFKLKFYNDKIESLYPYETLFPSEDLFPSERDEAWLVIEDDRIVSESLVITEALSESDNLEFGSCNANKMEIVVADVAEDVTGREFALSVEIGGYEMALGIYTVESFVRQADRRKRKITAYDRMTWFNTDVSAWFNELTFPMTLKSLRDSLCDYIGINQIDDSLPLDSMLINKTIEPEQISGLDVLKAICQINGCFGHVDKTGELKYIKLQQTGIYPSEDLFPSAELYPAEFGGDGEPVEIIERYKKLTYEDYLVDGITGIVIRQQEGDIGANVGTGENPYTIEGNFLVYGKSPTELLSIASTLLSIVFEKTYRPSTLECNAMPWIEIGDAIRAITRDDIVETFVMKRVIKGCQAMLDQISSTGTKKRKESFGIHQQIIQLEGKSAVIIKNVEEVSVKLTDLKEYTESQFKITADTIQAEVTRATKAEDVLSGRITVNADNITAEVKRASAKEGELDGKITVEAGRITTEVSERKAGEKDLRSAITQTAKEIRLEVSTNYVANGTVSVKLSGESGDVSITGNRLIVDSSNFKINKTGEATITGTINANKGKIGGANGFTIEANKMYSGKSSLSSSTNGVYVGTDGIALGSNNKFKVTNAGAITAVSGSIAKYTLSQNDLISGNVGMSSVATSGAVAFWAGNSNRNNAPFRVTNQGKLVASDATITGNITATGGTIAGFSISGSSLVADSDNSEIRGGNIITPSLMVGYTNNVIFSAVGDGNGEIIVRTNIDMTGHSFKNLGGFDLENLTVKNSLDAKDIVSDTLSANDIETTTLYTSSIEMPSIHINNGEIDANTVMAIEMDAFDIYLDTLGSSQGSSWRSVSKNIDWLVGEVESLSDKRVKNNILSIENAEALEFLLNLSPVTFQYTYDGHWSSGFIAQEVELIQDNLGIYFPLVGTDERTGYYKIKYTNYIPIIISAMQNLQEQINKLKGGVLT